MGQAYMILGDFDKARDAFSNALHINPENDTAAFGLQKIMDPDGVQGMVTTREAEGIAETTKPLATNKKIEALAPDRTPLILKPAAWAAKEKYNPTDRTLIQIGRAHV